MLEKYLPLGSVVLLKGGEKRVMIYGRRQAANTDGTVWDYAACLFPEGNVDDDHIYLFNHTEIERVFFLGLQDQEELSGVPVDPGARRCRPSGRSGRRGGGVALDSPGRSRTKGGSGDSLPGARGSRGRHVRPA